MTQTEEKQLFMNIWVTQDIMFLVAVHLVDSLVYFARNRSALMTARPSGETARATSPERGARVGP